MSGVSMEPTRQLLGDIRQLIDGAQIVATVSQQLVKEYGCGFNRSGDGV